MELGEVEVEISGGSEFVERCDEESVGIAVYAIVGSDGREKVVLYWAMSCNNRFLLPTPDSSTEVIALVEKSPNHVTSDAKKL